MTNPIAPLLASALTPLHPGSGRATGAVDLEITRDPLGYPYVRGSMVKGALKTALAHKHNCLRGDGRVRCRESEECRNICCLLGPDTGGDEETAPSRLSFIDLYPLFIPAPAYTLRGGSTLFPGIVYVTTPTLLSRALNLLSQDPPPCMGREPLYCQLRHALEKLSRTAEEHLNNNDSREDFRGLLLGSYSGDFNADDNDIYVKDTPVKITHMPTPIETPLLETTLKTLNHLYEHVNPLNATLILDNHADRMLIERLLQRATRIRLDRLTKTVKKGALWTEEYLPWGTLFLGAVAESPFRGGDCRGRLDSPAPGHCLSHISREIVQELKETLVIGGNETVGAGIMRLTLIYDD